jgi:hypothetical protein
LGDKSTARPADTSGLNPSPEDEEELRRAEALQESEGLARMAAMLYEEEAELDSIYAFEKTGYLVQSGCRDEWNAAQLKEWDGRLREYRRRVSLEGRTIDLCFRLNYESERSELSEQRRLAASEFGIAVLSAH